MELRFRFIGEALAQWRLDGSKPYQTETPLDPSAFHLGDLIELPEFGKRWLIVRARHWDIAKPALTLYLDLTLDNQPATNTNGQVIPIRGLPRPEQQESPPDTP